MTPAAGFGVVGLGSMGLGVALAARRRGLAVWGVDRRAEPGRELAAAGGTVAATPAALAPHCGVVQLLVLNAAQTEAVLFGADGLAAALPAGAVVLASATVDPALPPQWAARLAERGVRLIDAPVSGGAQKAAEGALTIMASGAPEAFEAAAPVLDAIAAKVYRLGDEPGTGSRVKMVNQHLAGVHIAAACEAMALGIRAGADPRQLYDVICHSAGMSWMFGNRVPHILDGDYRPRSAVNIFVKDLGIVLDAARALSLPLPLAAAAHQLYLAAAAAGHGGEDDAAVIKVWAHLAGIELPGGGVVTGLVLGVVADDFTGATDVAGMLVSAGLRTVQVIGVPEGAAPEAQAIVVALKSRTAPVAEAVRESRAAWRWLRAAGARQAYFKVCSTFDSTPEGNIGPVAEALMDDTGAAFTFACPAFPVNGRTVFRGHLFVGDTLLSESGMKEHPLTPMSDANLVRWLQRQCRRHVGLLRHDVVARGADALRERAAALQGQGVSIAIADAVDDADLHVLAEFGAELPLLVAGSGVALGLPAAYARRGWCTPDAGAARLDPVGGLAAVVSGSCSQATNAQVARWRADGRPAFALDALALAAGEPVVERALDWARARLSAGPVLLHATVEAATLREVQGRLGPQAAGALVEQALARIAAGLVESGVRRLVVAGGETSGAVVHALGVRQLRIGAGICPGVPWTQAEGRTLHLALKSGNFGGPGFFAEALAMEAA